MKKRRKWRQKWSFLFLNLKLRTKLISIIFVSLILLVITSVTGIQRLRMQFDELLYNAYQLVLTVSASAFSRAIDNTTDYIKTVATDTTIQEYLVSIKDEKYLSATTVRNLEQEMQRYLNDERNLMLYGMSISTEKGVIYNSSYKYDNGYDASLGTKFSLEELQEVVKQAPREKTLWLTQYTDSYGLVVVQNIRRISPMRLDSLGVLVGCLNLQPVIHDCAAQLQQENCYFSLIDGNGDAFYTYNNLGQEMDFSRQVEEGQDYVVLKQKEGAYFLIRGSMEKNGWDYLYAIPYDSIELAMQSGTLRIIFMMCLCMVAVVCATVLILRQILRDFDKLMNMIANVGDLDFESVELDSEDTRRSDEIGVLMQQFTKMSQKIDHLIQDNYESRLLAQEAKLQALEMQINPHFLYNTLESVRCCAKLGQDEDVCSIVESLGNIMHRIMSSHNELCLQQELELIDDYILIQKLRFDQRLHYSRQAEPQCCQAVLPKLTLLPLVENAVIHGVETCPDACYISLIVWKKDDMVKIQVKNTGTRFEEDFFAKLQKNKITPVKHGIGLLNVDSRLKLFFKKDYRIDFYNEDGQAVVEVTIPYWTERNID